MRDRAAFTVYTRAGLELSQVVDLGSGPVDTGKYPIEKYNLLREAPTEIYSRASKS